MDSLEAVLDQLACVADSLSHCVRGWVISVGDLTLDDDDDDGTDDDDDWTDDDIAVVVVCWSLSCCLVVVVMARGGDVVEEDDDEEVDEVDGDGLARWNSSTRRL